MRNIQNIIFDFDGVIADTERGRYLILAELLKQHNIKLENKFSVNDIAGIPTETFLKQNFSSLPTEDRNSIISERRRLFFNNLEKYCHVYDGAAKTIKDLNVAGYTLILATTNEKVIGEKLLKFIGIANDFSRKIYRNNMQNQQTNKKDYSVLPNRFDITPQNSIVIEDSVVGVSSAKANSFFCIAFANHDNATVRSIADLTINTFSELRELFNLRA